MKTKLLFPNRFKRIGWILLVPSTILGIACIFYDFSFNFLDIKVFAIFSDDFFGSDTVFGLGKNNITDEIVGVLFIIGALLVAFSKEKNEDEFIEKTRWESLVWATYINYFILIFCFLFFYNTSFLWVMIFNMFTILIFFILRFYFIIIMLKKSLGHEK